jgi:hypothetical protein
MPATNPATCSAIVGAEVRPGDSMPISCTAHGNSESVSMTKSAIRFPCACSEGDEGGMSLGRIPEYVILGTCKDEQVSFRRNGLKLGVVSLDYL